MAEPDQNEVKGPEEPEEPEEPEPKEEPKPEKRPRGRPRKEPKEPKEEPKPRGRPRKEPEPPREPARVTFEEDTMAQLAQLLKQHAEDSKHKRRQQMQNLLGL